MNSDVDFDRDIKAAFDRIVARTPDIGAVPTPTPSAQESKPGRIWVAVAAAGIVVVGTVAIGLARSSGPDLTPSIASVESSPDEPSEQTTLPASIVADPTTPGTTTAFAADPTPLSFDDLSEWFGRWDLAPQDATSSVVGSTGTIEYTVEVSESRFCVTISAAGTACDTSEDDAPIWGPQRPLAGFNDNSGGSGRWTRWFVVPGDIELSLWADQVPACDLQPFSLEQFGDAVLWACEAPGPAPRDMKLRATRGAETAIATLGNLPPETFPSPTTTSVSSGPAPLAIGGPLLLGAASALEDVGFKVMADESWHFSDVGDSITLLAATGELPPTVVLNIADDGTLDSGALDRLMQQTLREADRVLFVTTTVDREWATPNNELLRALPHTYANAFVLDWATEVANCPAECLWDDGLHLRPDGQSYFADLLADAVRMPTPFEATGLRVGDIIDPEGVPPGLGDDGQFDMTLVSDWVPVGRDGVVIGFVRKVDSHRVPPPPTDPLQKQEPNIIYDDNGQPIGQLGPDGFPVLDTD